MAQSEELLEETDRTKDYIWEYQNIEEILPKASLVPFTAKLFVLTKYSIYYFSSNNLFMILVNIMINGTRYVILYKVTKSAEEVIKLQDYYGKTISSFKHFTDKFQKIIWIIKKTFLINELEKIKEKNVKEIIKQICINTYSDN